MSARERAKPWWGPRYSPPLVSEWLDPPRNTVRLTAFARVPDAVPTAWVEHALPITGGTHLDLAWHARFAPGLLEPGTLFRYEPKPKRDKEDL